MDVIFLIHILEFFTMGVNLEDRLISNRETLKKFGRLLQIHDSWPSLCYFVI